MRDVFGRRNEDNNDDQPQHEDRLSRYTNEEKGGIPLENNFKKRQLNRAYEIARDDDEQRSIEIGIQDIDETIQYQFDKNFNFHVKQNGKSVQVPLIYNTRERWEWARRNQRLRTVNEKVIFPLIVYERTSVSRDSSRENANTLNQQVFDIGHPESNVFIASTRYSKRNRYDRFSVLNDRQPQREFYIVTAPNYVEVEYDFSIYTEYMFQMNHILEQISYLSNEYWGNPDGNLFKTTVENFSMEAEIENDIRFVRGTFSATVKGYLLPKHVADQATTKKAYTISKVRFGEQIVDNIDDVD